jgi:hypothetical protein
MKNIVSLFYILFLFSLSTIVENKRIYTISSDKEDMSDFLNAIFNINEGAKILKKCSTSYQPSRKSHQNFVEKYNILSSSLKSLMESKKYPNINGQKCNYETNNPDKFEDNNEELQSQRAFEEVFSATFPRSFNNFLKCIGYKELNKITNNKSFVDELLFFLQTQNVRKLFSSTCSINNIISQITEIDILESEAFKTIGKQLHSILTLVQPHIEYLKHN